MIFFPPLLLITKEDGMRTLRIYALIYEQSKHVQVQYNILIFRKIALPFAFGFFWRTLVCGVKSLVIWLNQESWDSLFYNCNLHQCSCLCTFKSIC